MCVIQVPQPSNHVAMHRSTICRPMIVIGQKLNIGLIGSIYFWRDFNLMHMSVTSHISIAAPGIICLNFHKPILNQ